MNKTTNLVLIARRCHLKNQVIGCEEKRRITKRIIWTDDRAERIKYYFKNKFREYVKSGYVYIFENNANDCDIVYVYNVVVPILGM